MEQESGEVLRPVPGGGSHAGCDEDIEAILRKRRLCFAGFHARMGDDRPPKTISLGQFEGDGEYVGIQESDWEGRLQEDLKSFGIDTNGRGWVASAKKVMI